jgi:hypothetical protein
MSRITDIVGITLRVMKLTVSRPAKPMQLLRNHLATFTRPA